MVGHQDRRHEARMAGLDPPAQMLRRRPDLPRHMAGGPDNPLGARAMYLGGTLYRIHGSNEPETIGQAVSSGCIRMTNEDVVDLYERVRVGTKVVVMRRGAASAICRRPGDCPALFFVRRLGRAPAGQALWPPAPAGTPPIWLRRSRPSSAR